MMTIKPSNHFAQAVINDDVDGFNQVWAKNQATIAAPCYNLMDEALRKHAKNAINASDEDGETALHKAIRYNRPEWVIRLLDHGADINLGVGFADHGRSTRLGPRGGNSPLHLALRCESPEILKILIERGAKLKLTDRDNNTVLDLIERAPKDPDLSGTERRTRTALGQQVKGWIEARELRATFETAGVTYDTASRPRL